MRWERVGKRKGKEDRSLGAERSGYKEKRHRCTATWLSRARIFQYRRWSATADVATKRGNACDDVRLYIYIYICIYVNGVYMYFPLYPSPTCPPYATAHTRYIRLYTPVGVKEKERERDMTGGTVARSAIRVSCTRGRVWWGGREFAVSVWTYTEGESCGKTERLLSKGNTGTRAARRWGPRTEPSTDDRPWARLLDESRGTDVGCATRRLVAVLSGVRSVGSASRIPPIERHCRGFFILLFAPKDGEEQRFPHLALSLLLYPSPFPLLNRSPYVFVGTERTLSFRDPLRLHTFSRTVPPVLLRRALFYVDRTRYRVLSFRRVSVFCE